MNQSLLRSLIRNLVLEAFSSGTIASRTRDFQKEDPSVTPEEAKYYLNRFSDVQNSPHVQIKDIQKYSWRDRAGSDGKTTTGLKDFIDSKWSTRSFYEPVNASGLEPVYESENGSLQVFLGDSREKCVTFRQNFSGRTGKSYSWCVSLEGASNLFSDYRKRGDEPVFYYLFDFERTIDDPLHACVIYVTNTGKYWLSDANNTGDKEYAWSTLAGIMPKIKNLQGIFKHIPVSEKLKKTISLMNDEQFSKLTRDQKEDYISEKHRLSVGQIRNLWSLPDRVDLINKYCNLNKNVLLPLDIWKRLPGSTRKIISNNFSTDETGQNLYRIHYLGENKIKGNIIAGGANGFLELPEGLEVEGSLSLKGVDVTELPSNLKVGRVLSLGYQYKNSELPRGIKCRGLNISESNIQNIDSNIFWDKADVPLLDISNSQITELPSDLLFVKQLKMTSTKVRSLPPSLKEVGDLFAPYSELNSLPEGFVTRRAILFSCNNLRTLPQNMIVTDDLDITDCPIDNLPKGLQVGGNIKLSKDTNITSLPLDLKLGGEIIIFNLEKAVSEFPFYQDYLKIKSLNKSKQTQPSIGESISLLKKVIRESLRDLD